jgi:TPR repeat protein
LRLFRELNAEARCPLFRPPSPPGEGLKPMRIVRNLACALAVLLIPVAYARADWQAAKDAYDKGHYTTAANELKPLAEKGNAKAQALLGLMYQFGRGVPRDLGRAFKLNKAAANQGNANGELHLGAMYLNGWGVPPDAAVGLEYVQLAAHQGLPEACFTLGMTYMGRPGVPPDVVKADTWLRVAAARGEPVAAQQRPQVEDRMTPDQVVRAKSLAEEWEADLPPVPKAKGKKP